MLCCSSRSNIKKENKNCDSLLEYYVDSLENLDSLLLIEQSMAVILNPSEQKIKKLQKNLDETSYSTIINNNIYYISESELELQKLNIKIEHTKSNAIMFDGVNKNYLLWLEKLNWGIIYFNREDCPVLLDITNKSSFKDIVAP